MLEDELLPNTRVDINFEIESDGNLIWQAGADCRVAINRMQLYVPRITFNSEGQSSYMSQYLKTHKWTYLRENIERSNSSQQRSGHFRISTGISKPRHVFVFIINDANIDAQTANPFLHNTCSVSTDPRTLSNCHLKVGNGNEYSEIQYTLITDMTRVYTSSETKGAVSGSVEKARRKFSSTGGKAPGCRLSPDHFQTVKRMLAPDWAQKMLCIIMPNRRTASSEFFSWVRTRRLLTRSRLVWLMHQRNARSQETFSLI